MRFLAGIGIGILGTATATIVARVIPPLHKGFGIGIFSMSTVLALAFGPFLGISLVKVISYQDLMLWLIAVSLASLLLLPCFSRLPMAGHHFRPVLQLWSYLDPRVFRFAVMIFLSFMGYGCLQAFMSTYAQSYGMEYAAPLFFPLYGLAAFISRPFAGRKLDCAGENGLVYSLLLLLVLAFLLICIKSTYALLFSAVLFGLAYGNLQSVGQAVSICLVTPSRFAQATSTFFIFMDFGIGLGPYLLGHIITAWGYDAMFWLLSGLSLFTVGVYYILHGKTAARFWQA